MATKKKQREQADYSDYTRGRKGQYREWLTKEGLIKIEGWARDGKTESQIAELMGIAPQTLWKWKNEYNSLAEALKNGKEVVDRQVESILLQKAMGKAKTSETLYTFDSEGNRIKEREIEKSVPPDTTAAIFWLKNRKPQEWRDRIHNEHNVTVSELSYDERQQRIEELKKKLE